MEPRCSHTIRDTDISSGTTSRPSSSSGNAGFAVRSGSTSRYKCRSASVRAEAISRINATTPGRIIRTSSEDNRSVASRSNTLGTSCSKARSTRNSRNCFQPRRPSASAEVQPNRFAANFKWSVRVCARAP